MGKHEQSLSCCFFLLFVHEGLWIGHPRLMCCVDIHSIVFVVIVFHNAGGMDFPGIANFFLQCWWNGLP